MTIQKRRCLHLHAVGDCIFSPVGPDWEKALGEGKNSRTSLTEFEGIPRFGRTFYWSRAVLAGWSVVCCSSLASGDWDHSAIRSSWDFFAGVCSSPGCRRKGGYATLWTGGATRVSRTLRMRLLPRRFSRRRFHRARGDRPRLHRQIPRPLPRWWLRRARGPAWLRVRRANSVRPSSATWGAS